MTRRCLYAYNSNEDESYEGQVIRFEMRINAILTGLEIKEIKAGRELALLTGTL